MCVCVYVTVMCCPSLMCRHSGKFSSLFASSSRSNAGVGVFVRTATVFNAKYVKNVGTVILSACPSVRLSVNVIPTCCLKKPEHTFLQTS